MTDHTPSGLPQPQTVAELIDKAITLIRYVEGPVYSPKCEDVREVLRELRAALLEPVGEGWAMVPKEPTEEMLDAACDVDARAQVERKNLVRFPGLMPHASAGDVWRIQYQAAIAASLAPKAEPADEWKAFKEWEWNAEVVSAWLAWQERARRIATPQADSAQPVADRSAEAMKVKQRLMKMAREVGGLTWADRMCIGQAITLIDAAMGTPQQAEQGRPMTFEDRLRDLEEEDQMFEDRDMGDS